MRAPHSVEVEPDLLRWRYLLRALWAVVGEFVAGWDVRSWAAHPGSIGEQEAKMSTDR